jgi:enoyl-CoA hydratase
VSETYKNAELNAAASLRITTSGRVGIFQLNRPDKLNSISSEVLQGLKRGLDEFERSLDVRAVLICATGPHFSTGADLDEVEKFRTDPDTLRAFLELGLGFQNSLENSRLPIVAAVQGLCLAGGLEMLLTCDVVFCGSSARFGDQHARFGLLPGWGGSQRLPRIVGLRSSLDLMFSGCWIDAPTAREWGLVNHVVEDAKLLEEATAYCEKLSKFSSQGLAAMKRLARTGLEMDLSDALDLETTLALDVLRNKDVEEGLSAFKTRRTPDFR